MDKEFPFHRDSVEGMKAMAALIAELERQGIEYSVSHDNYRFFIKIMGC